MPDLITARGDGETTPSTRLPAALLGRFRAGESIAELATDYDLPAEQVAWGLELAALREAILALPPMRRRVALCQVARTLRGLQSYQLIACRGPWRVLFDTRQDPEVQRG